MSEPVTNLDLLVVQFVAHELRAHDFHYSDCVRLDWEYNSAAEDKINRMTNIELLSVLGEALHWYRDGGDIGL